MMLFVLALSADERDLLEALFLHFEKTVYYLSYQILHHKPDAEDNTMQTFIHLSTILHRIDPDLRSKRNQAFICTIARYTALNVLRRKKIGLRLTQTVNANPYINDIDLSAYHFREIVHSMAAVSPIDTELLILKYVYGLKSKELAALTGLSVFNIDVKLHRAKKRMRENRQIQMDQKGDDE